MYQLALESDYPASPMATALDFPAPHLGMHDASFLMWAILAIARLHQIIPSDAESVANDDIVEFRLRNAINHVGQYFSDTDPAGSAIWTSFNPLRTDQLLAYLKNAAIQAYFARGEGVPNEFAYLYAILETFHLKTRTHVLYLAEHPLGSQGTISAIADVFERQVGEVVIPTVFQQLRELPSADEPAEYMHSLSYLIEHHVSSVCHLVEGYIERQSDLKIYKDYDADGEIGQSFVNLVHERFQTHVQGEFTELLYDLGVTPGSVTDEDSWETKMRIRIYFRKLAWFFSYASPLLENFHIVDDSDDEVEDEWEEYEPTELEDVLPGPANVHVDEVSTITLTDKDSACGICFDAHDTMRKTNRCGHKFGEECLATQLSTYHQARYKCASCRTLFFADGRV